MFSYMRREPGFYRRTAALALPVMFQNLITHAMGLLDTFMVGLLGELPLAAVTLANIPCFVITFVIFGIQSGSSILISQNWGKKDMETINRVMGVALYCAGAVTTLYALICFFFPHQFISLFGNDPEVIALAAEYIRYIGFSFVADFFVLIYVAAHRSTENPKLGLCILGISVVSNTFLNWVLIFGKLGAPRLGVTGAAVATLLARCIGLTVALTHALFSRRLSLRPRLLLVPGRIVTRQFFRYATPVVINETLWGLGTSLYTTVMAHMEGSQEILAAQAIAGNIDRVCTVAIIAVSHAAAVIIGKEIGAGRSRKEVYELGACLSALAFLVGLFLSVVLLAALYLFIAPFLYPIFDLSPEATRVATVILTTAFAILPLAGYNCLTIVGVLRGGGDVRAATLIDNIPLWCIALPLTALSGLVFKLDIVWVCLSMRAENLSKTFFGLRRFRSRAWIHDLTLPTQTKEE